MNLHDLKTADFEWLKTVEFQNQSVFVVLRHYVRRKPLKS